MKKHVEIEGPGAHEENVQAFLDGMKKRTANAAAIAEFERATGRKVVICASSEEAFEKARLQAMGRGGLA